METKGLLFIPDISGFTRFVAETEIGHSRLIIQELLELLINANQIGLEVSEIEGDAILFYKFGDPPELEVLYKQVEKMFCLFHKNLIAYDQRRYCQCNACTGAANLSLKVITHYGEFTGYQVKQFSKLIGKDVIVAHQLLKNDIALHEYWLVTRDLLPDDPPADLTEWMNWSNSTKETETGAIHFHYTQLSQLKETLASEPLPPLDLSGKKKVLTASREYDTDLITLFHAAGAFEYRHLWWEGVQKVEELNHFLPRVGMRSRWIMDTGEVINYSTSYMYTADRIEFSETDEQDSQIVYYTLIKKSDQKTELILDIYKAGDWLTKLLFGLSGRQQLATGVHRSLDRLAPLIKEIRL